MAKSILKKVVDVNTLTKEAVVARLETQIVKGLEDYFAFVASSPVQLDDFRPAFIHRLAVDAYYSKSALREMLRKSPAWDEDLQALVINGNRTHEPDTDYIKKMAWGILTPAITSENKTQVDNAVRWFVEGGTFAESLLELAPKANLRQKKSKVFSALCKALGVWEDSGEFQQKYSDLCNEFNQKKIEFKLYLSINPVHFLTMSNPHGASKYEGGRYKGKFLTNGESATMVSCHSLTSDYCYKNGAVGYARDFTTMIAFTASDDKNPATLNYRKTNRQLFMYKVGGGVLLQSRLYTTCRNDSYGGVDGDEGQETSTLFRHLVQREICECEQVPNFWGKPEIYDDCKICISTAKGFMGYPDWLEISNCARVSVRKDCKKPEGFLVGNYSLGIDNGKEFYFTPEFNHTVDDMLYHPTAECGDCGFEYDEEKLTKVYNADGYLIRVCDSCLDEHYFYCDECRAWHHRDNLAVQERYRNICRKCAEGSGDYFRCEDCGEWHHINNGHWVGNDYSGYYVCDSCIDDYNYCDECKEYHKHYATETAYNKNGDEITVCDDCRRYHYAPFEVTDADGNRRYEWWHDDAVKNGLCPHCQVGTKKSA